MYVQLFHHLLLRIYPKLEPQFGETYIQSTATKTNNRTTIIATKIIVVVAMK